MSTNALVCSAFALLSLTSLIACVGDDPAPSTTPTVQTPTANVTPTGERGGACYPNQTCNEGLSCEDGLVCVTSKSTPNVAPASDQAPANEEPKECKKATPFTAAVINPPAPKSASCTDAQISQLANSCFGDAESPDCMYARGQFATCSACVFGSKIDVQWKPILTGTVPPTYNSAGCIDNVSKVSGCGSKYERVIGCFNHYCNECGAKETDCQKDVAQGSGECKSYLLDQTCGTALDAAEKQCLPADQTPAALHTAFIAIVTAACK